MSDIILATSNAQETTEKQLKARRWRLDLAGYGFVLPFLIIYALFLIWPVILGLRMSFFNWTISGAGASDFLGFANYQELLGDPAFWKSLGVTLLFTIISTPILVIIALVLALLVNRAIPAQGFFRAVFFAPFILPVSVVALIWNWLYQPGFGLINGILASLGLKEVGWLADPSVSLMSVIILTVWWTVGFNFVLYLAGLQQIPQELQEAASLDGAGAWARIRWVTIPLLNRTTTMIIILQVIASLQIFNQAYLLMGGDGPNFSTRGVVQYIYESGFTTYRVGFASSMSYILFLIILIVSLGQFALLTRQRREA
ncbi:carbohydrate ABC transporter permease [Ktedonospora formicarum]|uniref:Sugar ABC transporter permease n=1 Tax=Ktedonospora formicarum TaxID=2778364 RepID=A0A8J3MUE9_9CHLR|nr:sugar ABC transporter permease [Ktedonospora formicarum]GHO49272.1 sugar ABC transporter permease [Ktedonospora formicarum]